MTPALLAPLASNARTASTFPSRTAWSSRSSTARVGRTLGETIVWAGARGTVRAGGTYPWRRTISEIQTGAKGEVQPLEVG